MDVTVRRFCFSLATIRSTLLIHTPGNPSAVPLARTENLKPRCDRCRFDFGNANSPILFQVVHCFVQRVNGESLDCGPDLLCGRGDCPRNRHVDSGLGNQRNGLLFGPESLRDVRRHVLPHHGNHEGRNRPGRQAGRHLQPVPHPPQLHCLDIPVDGPDATGFLHAERVHAAYGDRSANDLGQAASRRETGFANVAVKRGNQAPDARRIGRLI